MKIIYKLGFAVLAATAMMLIPQSDLSAQQGCWECEDSDGEGPPGTHQWLFDGNLSCDEEWEVELGGCYERPTGEDEGIWYLGTCAEQAKCLPTEDLDYDALVDAVDDGELSTIQYSLTEFSDVVAFNMDRQAIQIRGCSGAIIAHLPVSDGLFTALLKDLED